MTEREVTERATVESGDVYDDPSEDALLLLLEDIEDGREAFVIVERLADASGQTYAQSTRADDGRYVVEHRAGAPRRHFHVVVDDVRAAHALLTAWTFDLPGWREAGWSPGFAPSGLSPGRARASRGSAGSS
ncbi:hypothetical protein [Cellulomonas cellasea]|uniref:Uncharacterized protein n=1 Tax=Cellulomonas cellasea TaxID=43670 RepID=A0A7W4UDR7_9CELL|nr:hypothetical protein [Cellulomonas cellasea]MBB2922306.1 hypothetical protein [Cellulomonas cellasea]